MQTEYSSIDEVISLYDKSISKEPKIGKLKGRIVRFTVADSYSYYIITKETDKSVYLELMKIKGYDNYEHRLLKKGKSLVFSKILPLLNFDYKSYLYFKNKEKQNSKPDIL